MSNFCLPNTEPKTQTEIQETGIKFKEIFFISLSECALVFHVVRRIHATYCGNKFFYLCKLFSIHSAVKVKNNKQKAPLSWSKPNDTSVNPIKTIKPAKKQTFILLVSEKTKRGLGFVA